MITEGVFFPSSGRSVEQSTRYREYAIRPKPDFHKGFINSFPEFQRIVEVTLAPGEKFFNPGYGDLLCLIIPVVGTIKIEGQPEIVYLDPGCMATIETGKDLSLVFSNLLERDLVHFLVISCTPGKIRIPGFRIYSIDIDNINTLTSTPVNNRITLSAGKFQGRRSADLALLPDAAAFVYVINGAFEVANRLMEAGDGLGLYGISELLEFEALAEESILAILHNH